MSVLRRATEVLARKTSRRRLFGRGADVMFGALAGVAAGSLAQATGAVAGPGTLCAFPGPPCACDHCVRVGSASNGICAKPCLILTEFYAAGCWVAGAGGAVTCCDCDCQGLNNIGWCGCGSDYHSNPTNCLP